jgi:hypothetical protein
LLTGFGSLRDGLLASGKNLSKELTDLLQSKVTPRTQKALCRPRPKGLRSGRGRRITCRLLIKRPTAFGTGSAPPSFFDMSILDPGIGVASARSGTAISQNDCYDFCRDRNFVRSSVRTFWERRTSCSDFVLVSADQRPRWFKLIPCSRFRNGLANGLRSRIPYIYIHFRHRPTTAAKTAKAISPAITIQKPVLQ